MPAVCWSWKLNQRLRFLCNLFSGVTFHCDLQQERGSHGMLHSHSSCTIAVLAEDDDLANERSRVTDLHADLSLFNHRVTLSSFDQCATHALLQPNINYGALVSSFSTSSASTRTERSRLAPLSRSGCRKYLLYE